MEDTWTSLHDAAWKGHARRALRQLKRATLTSSGQSPLYLALSRWGKSTPHQSMINALWDADPAPQLARWGDTAWGGGLNLLDLVVQKGLVGYIERCKSCGLLPHERTWSMALLHEGEEPLMTLGLAFDPPSYLPENDGRVSKMLTARQAFILDQDTDQAQGGGGARRL